MERNFFRSKRCNGTRRLGILYSHVEKWGERGEGKKGINCILRGKTINAQRHSEHFVTESAEGMEKLLAFRRGQEGVKSSLLKGPIQKGGEGGENCEGQVDTSGLLGGGKKCCRSRKYFNLDRGFPRYRTARTFLRGGMGKTLV